MKYELRPVNNGWIIYIDPIECPPGMEHGEFVFSSLADMSWWLSERHIDTTTTDARLGA
jgi:hypothetical protein